MTPSYRKMGQMSKGSRCITRAVAKLSMEIAFLSLRSGQAVASPLRKDDFATALLTPPLEQCLTRRRRSGRMEVRKSDWHWGSLGSQAERATACVVDPLNLTWVMPA